MVPQVPLPMTFNGYEVMRDVEAKHKELRRRHPLIVPDTVHKAGKLADRYLIEGFLDEDDESGLGRGIISWGSRLIYTIQFYGMDFEGVCILSDVTLARSIATLTPDNRLGSMRRHQALRSSLVNASFAEQVTRLAVLFAEAAHVASVTVNTGLKQADKELLQDWVDRARDLIPAFTHLKMMPYFERQLSACDELLERAGRPVGCAKRPRRL